MTVDTRSLYIVLCKRFIAAGVITQSQCDTIERKGHRKQRYYRRHILDLVEFVSDELKRRDITDPYLQALCETGRTIAYEQT